MRTRVKFCGIGTVQEALQAAALGVDALGLVFYAASARALELERAREIAVSLPPFVTRVALFLDADAATVGAVLERVEVDLLQFHGTESPAYCAQFGLPYVKGVPMAEGWDLGRIEAEYADARGFLLDSNAAGAPGGSGKQFRWDVATAMGKPVMIAGGLRTDNVGEAIRRLRPYGVDVSSGIEAEKGTKSLALMRAFIEEVQRVDSELRRTAA